MATEFDLVVRGGTVVAHDQVRTADLGIVDGLVAAVGSGLARGREEYDAAGLHLLPGLVDVHVHMREPGWPEKGDFAEGTRAAAVGGVTTVIDMPNSLPPVVDAAGLVAKRDLLAPRAHVDFGLYGLFGNDNVAEFAGLAEAGAMGLKLYMARSVSDLPIPDNVTIVEGLRAARAAGLPVGVHAEDPAVIERHTRRLRAAGRTDPPAYSEARPVEAEAAAIATLGRLAAVAGVGVHLHHLSSAAGMEAVRALRRQGLEVGVEVIVAHLALTVADYARHGTLVAVNPPLRAVGDMEELWKAIADREVDVIATDHAPHTPSEQGQVDVWHANGGFAGVETMLPVMLSMVGQGRLRLTDVVRLCSFNPAQRWRVPGKGELRPGMDADLVAIDLARPGVIRSASLRSRHKITPFEGLASPSSVRTTFLRGAVVAHEGLPVGPVRGRFLAPHSGLAVEAGGGAP